MTRSLWKAVRTLTVAVPLMGGAFVLSSPPVQAAPAPDDHSVLILGPTVSGGAGSREAVLAAANGFTVVVDSAANWGARTMAEFGSFRAIILGDATCTSVGAVAAAAANKAVWGPAINGNVIINGTDPVFHQGQGGDALTEGSIKFAADEPTKTGAYISLSCYYHGTAPATSVPVLDPFGTFTARGVGCFNDAHIVAVHPALAGITDVSLSNWSCSVHEAFDSFPTDFLPLAIAEGITGSGSLTFSDGSFGIPYVLARGETLSPILCGNGILETGEQCDDGNTANGDGCSAQCTIESDAGAICNGLPATTGCKVNGVVGDCVGTSGNNFIEGTSGDDVIVGLGGNDLLKGFGGNDTICGDEGNDQIEGGSGNDWIEGGSGKDLLKGQAGVDTIYGQAGDDTIEGGPGNDTLLDGGDDNDLVKGQAGVDTCVNWERQQGCELP